jgi:hypothetical protein
LLGRKVGSPDRARFDGIEQRAGPFRAPKQNRDFRAAACWRELRPMLYQCLARLGTPALRERGNQTGRQIGHGQEINLRQHQLDDFRFILQCHQFFGGAYPLVYRQGRIGQSLLQCPDDCSHGVGE